MLRAALLALTLAPVALAVDPVDELTMAIRNGSPREALEKTQVWLRSHSANAKDTMTSMPLLSHAVAAGDARVAELLLSAGAAVDGKDLTGATPLISATSAGDAVLVRLLLSRGASVDARGASDNTPLSFAAAYGFYDVAAELLNAGAAKELINAHGLNAYEQAKNGRHRSIMRLLEPKQPAPQGGATRRAGVDARGGAEPVDEEQRAPYNKDGTGWAQLPGDRYEEPDSDDDEGNEEVRWIAEQLRAPDNKMTIEEVLAKAKRRRAERSRGKEPMPSGFREDDSHVGYSGGPGEGRIVAPRLG